jgi:hypothetical protein
MTPYRERLLSDIRAALGGEARVSASRIWWCFILTRCLALAFVVVVLSGRDAGDRKPRVGLRPGEAAGPVSRR